MPFDPEVANSSGFFKDPVTKQDLTGNEPRVVDCAIDSTGSLVWPQIRMSDGSVGRIVYRLWTEQEKAIYKIYREGIKAKAELATHSQVTPARTHSQVGVTAEQYISVCDCTYGVWMMDGIVYELLGKRSMGTYMPVPRSSIPYEDRERIGVPR